MKNKGIFCVSLDTELLWGRWDKDYEKFISRAKKVRTIVGDLLSLFDKYEISATWAIVGALYKKSDKEYPELWSAPDLIDKIKKYSNQEIACHSYSHKEFAKLKKGEAKEELRKCPKAKSFVFPRNKIAHLEILKKHGYIAYRGYEPHLRGFRNSKLLKFIEIFDLLLLIPHTSKPEKVKGLVNIPGNMYFLSARGLRKHIPLNIRYLKAKRSIDKAIKKGGVFHLWFHPIDLADNTERQLLELEKILKYAHKRVEEDKLLNLTMEKIATTQG